MASRRTTVSPRNLLLGTVSALVLSIGTAHAVAVTVGDATEASPFFFGDKKVSFDPAGCTDCASATLSALDGPDIGFRVTFGAPTSQSVSASSSGPLDDNSLGPQSLGFTVMVTDPLFQIVGVSLSADAGVTASFDWQANGEDISFGGSGGSADASGDIDLSLSNGGEIVNLDNVFDAGVAGLNIFGDDSDSTDSSGIGGPVGGAVTPAVSQVLTLDWFLGAAAECIPAFELPSCTADSEAFITSIDVRFVQEPVPEPATLGIFGAGLIGLGWLRRRRRSA